MMKFRIFSILSILLLFLVACGEKQEAKSTATAVEATQEKPMAETPTVETPVAETPTVETPVAETPAVETMNPCAQKNPCAKKNPCAVKTNPCSPSAKK